MCPFGAQVALTEGRSEKPDSSWKMIHARRRRAFYYHGPTVPGPGGNRVLVGLGRSSRGTLPAPAEPLAQDRPGLSRRVAHPGHRFDHRADPSEGPQFVRKTVLGRSLGESLFDLLELFVGDQRQSSGALRTAQTREAVLGPRGVPL